MLDANEARLTKIGSVSIDPSERGECQSHVVIVKGFEGVGCSCRDVAVLAMVWAIGQLQRELNAALKKPGGGSVAIE